MLEAINYVHLHGRQLYMTVNTLVKEDEMDDLYDYLLPYYQAGLDAVIVQDMGVFSYIREHFPDLPVHASTQMTITGPEGAALMTRMGAVASSQRVNFHWKRYAAFIRRRAWR